MINRRSFAAGALALATGTRFAQAQSPIRILVGYPAGGGVDIVARLLGEPIKAAFGQAVIVENRPGASAMIAANAVAKSPPDGSTLLMAASGEVAINQHLHKEKMTYDPLRELSRRGAGRDRAVRRGGRGRDAGEERRRTHRLRARQSRQAVVLLLRHRQSATACRAN